jgi:hypothetical protein
LGVAVATGAPEKVINPMLDLGSLTTTKSNQKKSDKYWLYFVDEKLVSWGQAGDWDEAQKQISHIDFSCKDRLSCPSE